MMNVHSNAVRVLTGLFCVMALRPFAAYGSPQAVSDYKVLPAITKDNLAIFPVVAANTNSKTDRFLTLDEGLHSGEVVVTERGGMLRFPGGTPPTFPLEGRGYDRARVNQVVLTNTSTRPLILLAGEIIVGGKQDRVVAKDRIVPPNSQPIDLSVFCVEPHRWIETTSKFSVMPDAIAAPGIRQQVLQTKSQEAVWDRVSAFRSSLGGFAGSSAAGSSSYAAAVKSSLAKKRIESIAEPLSSYLEALSSQLRDQKAVGVVVAVSGELVWVDTFASPELFQRYWPKLVRSYAAEAMAGPERIRPAVYRTISIGEAHKFLTDIAPIHESAESEPGVFRNTEIKGKDFDVFILASLLPDLRCEIHFAKMRR